MATSNGEGRAAHRQKAAERPEPENQPSHFPSDATSVLTAAALIGGVALLEPELIAGMAIGAGVTLLSGWAGTMSGPQGWREGRIQRRRSRQPGRRRSSGFGLRSARRARQSVTAIAHAFSPTAGPSQNTYNGKPPAFVTGCLYLNPPLRAANVG